MDKDLFKQIKNIDKLEKQEVKGNIRARVSSLSGLNTKDDKRTSLPSLRKKRANDEKQTLIMCENTSKEDLLLYLNLNKNKHMYVNLINGILYGFSRLSCVPLLISLTLHTNLISLMMLVIVFMYSLKVKRLFIKDLKMMSWVLTSIVIFHTIHKYLQIVFIDKYELEKNYYNG